MFCEWVAPHLPAERGITSEKKLLATLWMVANKESYRSVADRFGFNKGTLHRIVKSVSQTLVTLRGTDVITKCLSNIQAICRMTKRIDFSRSNLTVQQGLTSVDVSYFEKNINKPTKVVQKYS